MEENRVHDNNLNYEAESNNVIRPLPSSVRQMQSIEDESKDIDLRSINKEANKLARQFDKGNKQILEEIKKQEKEQKVQELEQEKTVEEKISTPNAPTTRLGLIGILAVPYILIGALLLWSCFFSDTLPNMLSVLVVIFSLTVYSFGAYELFKGIFRASSVKEKVWSIIFGALCIISSALLVIYRNQAEPFVILGVGVLGVCLDFVYLLVVFIRAKKTRYVPYKAVVSFIVFVASVLFIVQSFISDVNVLNIITGVTALIAGTLEFSV